MDYNFKIQYKQAFPSLFMRQTCAVAELPQMLQRSYGKIMQYLETLKQYPQDAPYALYHNMDMQALDVQAGFLVSKELPPQGDIQYGELPAGRYATGLFIGPYNQMEPFYDALNHWLEEQKEKPAGPVFEWYFSPPDTPPEKIRTEVWFALQ